MSYNSLRIGSYFWPKNIDLAIVVQRAEFGTTSDGCSITTFFGPVTHNSHMSTLTQEIWFAQIQKFTFSYSWTKSQVWSQCDKEFNVNFTF